jgi:TM2 domain-containing membrane protein YozV
MNCANHSEIAATAFCRECGKPMCADCQKPALGSIFCAEHLPAAAAPPVPPTPPPPPIPEKPRVVYTAPVSPYTAPRPQVADPSVHPGLALVLGFAPGVGAIYNGQYAKGLVHAVVFGLLISVANNVHNGGLEGLVGVMIATWVIYQAFEAYHTARKRRYGQHVEEFSSLFDVKPHHGRFPVGGVMLIGLGFLLLLDTTDIISFSVLARFWPALLIALGVYMLYARLNPAPHDPARTVPFDERTRQ